MIDPSKNRFVVLCLFGFEIYAGSLTDCLTDRRRPLTEKELVDALYESDEDLGRNVNDGEDEEEPNDETSSSEMDYQETGDEESDEQEGSDDSDANDEPPGHSQTFIGKDGTEWNATPIAKGKTRAHNIITTALNKVKLPPEVHVDTPCDAFNLFFDDTVIGIVVTFTNKEAVRILGDLWKPVDDVEIRAFLGLLITAGRNKQGMVDYNELWNPLYGNPVYRACMSRNRFTQLLRFIRFDDKATRTLRRQKDKLAPIRDLWDRVNTNLLKYYLPGSNLTIDEQLVPFRGRVSFRQYLPSKPDKYGMKIWWICDSGTSYPLRGIPYLGKEGLNRAENLAQKVVEDLCEPFLRTKRNITFDNFFTSYELASSLLTKGLTCVGTLRKNKRCIPPNFLPHRRRNIESYLFGFQKTMTLVSYVPKKNRCVILLSTMHNDSTIDEENKNKSEINKYYNSTKGGVDTLDQMVHTYSVKRKTNRWPLVYFFNIIDVCGVASFVIWRNIHPDWHISKKRRLRKIFLREITTELVLGQIRRRSLSGLHKSHTSLIQTTLNQVPTTAETSAREVRKRKRCYICPSKKSRMSTQLCDKCKQTVCGEHSEKILTCTNCKLHK